MTDAERLEWACEVLNREGHRGHYEWVIDGQRVECYGRYLELDEAIPIALALDEQARRLPEWKQAEWAAAELSRRNHAGCDTWKRVGTCVDATDIGGYHASTAVCALSAADAVAIAESLIRREMLGDTSDANAKGVKP